MLAILCIPIASAMAAAGNGGTDLTQLSLEDLANVEVTSVSRKAERLVDAAAAIYVISGEEIRRSGYTTVADALRLAPGVQVAQIDASKWAITARGFAGSFANKLLVLIDGRSVYTPLFSGVYWDIQDVPVDEIERIEVIRGPGATLWGANAVNGVINIITKSARHTRGGLVRGAVGNYESALGYLRWGGSLGENAWWRVFGSHADKAHSIDTFDVDVGDGWNMTRGGLRLDWQPNQNHELSFVGSVHDGSVGVEYTFPRLTHPWADEVCGQTELVGMSVVGHWIHRYGRQASYALQVNYDWQRRQDVFFGERRHNFEIDGQHQLSVSSRLDFIWGLAYRLTADTILDTEYAWTEPGLEAKTSDILSAFGQLEISLVHNLLRATVGSKFEHNDFTGLEIQPNGRLLFTPHRNHSLWAAISRAVRTPSRVESDGHVAAYSLPPDGGGNPFALVPLLVRLEGNPAFAGEELVATELGYRTQLQQSVTVDAALYYNRYRNLRFLKAGFPHVVAGSPAYALMPLQLTNDAEGYTYGGELAVDWAPPSKLLVRAAYSYLEMKIDAPEAQLASDIPGEYVGNSPHHQFMVRASVTPRRDVDIDAVGRYVSELPGQDVSAYVSADARVAWRPLQELEIGLAGRNLLQAAHREYNPEMSRLAIQRSRGFYLSVTWTVR
ncbi:MAG: TonB-dependent receptor [bacterium]